MEEQEAYRILKLEYGAEPHKVKSAYRKMALKLHPDRNGSNTEFGKITNAYSNPSLQNQSKNNHLVRKAPLGHKGPLDHRIHLNRTGQNIQKSTNKMKVFGQSMSASFGRIMEFYV